MPGADFLTLVSGPGQQAVQTAKYNVALTVASAASIVVVKSSAGWVQSALITATGASQTAITIYDNAATLAGTVIGFIPASATVTGIPYAINAVALNGITASGSIHNPAVTLFYS